MANLVLSVVAVLAVIFLAVLTAHATETSSFRPIVVPRGGIATWYGEGYRGKKMANGQPFDPDAFTCATWDWPLGTELLVQNGDRVVSVVVTDRGPDKRLGVLIDLSRAAFERIAPLDDGRVRVLVFEKQHEGLSDEA